MQTQTATIAAMIAELIETHMSKCDEVPHVISSVNETRADIDSIAVAPDLEANTARIVLALDDGSDFLITLQPVPVKKWTVIAFIDCDYGVHPLTLHVEAKSPGAAWDEAVAKARETCVGTIPAHGGSPLREDDIEAMTEIATFAGWHDE